MDEHDLGNMISNIKEAIKTKEEVSRIKEEEK
jgi:hypothetical protein